MEFLTEATLKLTPALTMSCSVLFGLYFIVQKRTSGNAYGAILTDLAMRALVIEGVLVFGYDTSNSLMTASRFACICG